MSKPDNFEIIQKYFTELVAKSHSDGNQVVRVNYAIIGLMVLTHNSDKLLEISDGYKDYSNILWFYKKDEKYALVYNKKTGDIEIRKNIVHGPAILSLSNLTPLTELIVDFEKL